MNAMKWVLAGALAAGAQTAGIDTSLLKSGNTWVYERDEEERSAGNVYDGFSGITRFAVDSVSYRGDTLRFRVIRKDSLRSKVMYETLPGSGLREYRDTYVVDTVRFSVTPGGISPSPGTHLLFLDGQTFSSTDGRVAYRGDTLRYRQASTGGPGICTWTRSRNLEKVRPQPM